MEPLMVPPSHGWFEVSSERRGSGSAVGDRADSVSDRAVGERTKSATGQHAPHIKSHIDGSDVPGLPSPLNASAASRTSGSSMLTLVSLLAFSSCALHTLAVSMGLPISSGMRGIPSGTRGNVALCSDGSCPHCAPSKYGLGLDSIEFRGV
jgi:hypothetical protein